MNDEQFEQFIKLLDAALVSDDKKIKSALRKFMFIMALNLSDDDCEPGPFTKMMETMDDLQRRLAQVEGQNTFTQTPYVQTPYTPYVGGTGSPPWSSGSSTSGNITFTNATSTTTIPSTTTTTSGNITLTGVTSGSAGCTGFTAGAYSGMGNTITTTSYDLGYEVDTGTTIKEDIKDKLKKLVSIA